MKHSIFPLIMTLLLAALPAAGQNMTLEDLAVRYTQRFCDRIERTADWESFREQDLVKALYREVLEVPSGAVREAELEGTPVPFDAPWVFFDPSGAGRPAMIRPPASDGTAPDSYSGARQRAYFRVSEPGRICTGRADKWKRIYYRLHFSFTVSAPSRAALDAVRSGQEPLRLRIYHLEEKTLSDHDLTIHLTGVLEP